MLGTVDIRREARAAGIRGDGTIDLAAVEQRRQQLWLVLSAALVLVSAAVGAVAVFPHLADHLLVDLRILQVSLPAICLTFALYGVEKERALRRLTQAVVDEEVSREQLTVLTRQLRAALDAGKELSATLETEAVVDTLLRGALELFGAADGSVVLLGPDDSLVLAATRGNDRGAHLDHDALEAVAMTRVPLRLTPEEPGERNAMIVPLVADGDLLGILTVSAAERAAFTDHDLSVLAGFGEYAATALVNARRFEAQRADSERLRAIESARDEFGWLATP